MAAVSPVPSRKDCGSIHSAGDPRLKRSRLKPRPRSPRHRTSRRRRLLRARLRLRSINRAGRTRRSRTTKVAASDASDTPPRKPDAAPTPPVKPEVASSETPRQEPAGSAVAQPKPRRLRPPNPTGECASSARDCRACSEGRETRQTGGQDRRAVANQSRGKKGRARGREGQSPRREEGQGAPPSSTARPCRTTVRGAAYGRSVRPDAAAGARAHALKSESLRPDQSRSADRSPAPIPTMSRRRAQTSRRPADRARASGRRRETPEPQLVTIGASSLTPAFVNALRRSSSGFIAPVAASNSWL